MILILSFEASTFAQKIETERLSLGLFGGYLVKGGDFNKYWNGNLNGGISGNYSIDQVFAAEAGLRFSVHDASTDALNQKIPDIYLVDFAFGFKAKLFSLQSSVLYLSAGFHNSLFIFLAEDDIRLKNNRSEQEFGFYSRLGLAFNFHGLPIFELFYNLENIYSNPEQLINQNFGVLVYIF